MDFRAVMFQFRVDGACFATGLSLRQVSLHHHGVQLFPAGILVIAFGAADDAKSSPVIEGACGTVIFFDFEEYLFQAVPCQMPEVCSQQLPRIAAPALMRRNGNEKNFGLVYSGARHEEAQDRAPLPQPVCEGVALDQHLLEFVSIPTTVKSCAV